MKNPWVRKVGVGERLRRMISRVCLVGVEQGFEIQREDIKYRHDLVTYVTEGMRVLLSRKPWGFWVGDLAVTEVFKRGANQRMDNAERAVGYQVRMEIWTVRPYYWVRVGMGKVLSWVRR